jgi:hypothetical protein
VLATAKRLLIGGILAVVLWTVGPMSARAQEGPVPCYGFEQDALGHWIATTPLSMNSPLGMIDIMPGHRVSVSVARMLDARCS